jgi:DNA-binding LytR/AlgR family response regulator
MTKEKTSKILIVEDEMIIAADLSIQLTKLGYDVIGIQTRAEDTLRTLEENKPDIILMDIILSGEMNGITAAQEILKRHQIPVIFLTSNVDDATFQQAKTAKPYAYISKPFRKDDLSRAIEITLERIGTEHSGAEGQSTEVSTMEDRLFIKYKDQLVKVVIQDILFLEADRNYCKLISKDQEYMLSIPLGKIEDQLSPDLFLRIHRSFIVNLDQIDTIHEHYEFLTIRDHTIPISRRLRDEVAKRLKMI